MASVVSQLFDAVSGLFLEALGTDMTAMEEYFPFVTKAYDVMQVTAWAILILITIWQLFRAFGGPITEAENPWHLLVRSSVYGLLIGYAKPIFSLCLNIARAPYTTLMELSMTAEDFTFAGVEQTLTNGLLTIVSAATVVGLILILILEIALGWNYFKLLLETVERYIVVGVLCYTSPLAFSMGGSKTTSILAFLFIPVYQANPLCRPFPRRTVSCTRESDSGRVQQHRPDRRRTGRLRFLPFPERHPLPGYSGHARRSEPWSASEPVSQQPLVRNHRQLRHPAYARLYG